jgi:methionine sulfoxide reductase heme-binding subunit
MRSIVTTPPVRFGNERSCTQSPEARALTILLAILLVYLFATVHGQWSPMHRWNKATADASLALLTLTMAIGPGARIWSRLRWLIPHRREFGIYTLILALVHTAIILDGWVEWELERLFGLAFHPGLGRYVMVQHGFGLANVIGIWALAYGLILTLSSNDKSMRILSAPVWKFLQRSAYVLWALVVMHTGYFLFIHFLDFHRPLPEPNALRWPFVVLVAFVVMLRSAAFIQTWRQRRNATAEAPTSPGQTILAGRNGG